MLPEPLDGVNEKELEEQIICESGIILGVGLTVAVTADLGEVQPLFVAST